MQRIGIIDNLGDLSLLNSGLKGLNSNALMEITGGNTGNVAFVNAVNKLIKNPTRRIFWYSDVNYVQSECDLIVVCCANQLGAHTDLQAWADALERFKLPVVLIGIGAQSTDSSKFPELSIGTKNFVNQVNLLRFSSSSENILTRGEFSSKVLEGVNISSKPFGCPSIFTSSDKYIGEKIRQNQNKQIVKLAVASGNPWDGLSAEFEASLVELVNKYNGKYVIQHPLEMFQFALNEIDQINDKTKNRYSEVFKTLGSFEQILAWFTSNSQILVDAEEWMQYLSAYDAVFGPRYHGVALGIQAGIPGCVVTIDSRTKELCETTSIKNISINSVAKLNADELVGNIYWSDSEIEAFANRRVSNAKRYIDFFVENGIEPSEHLVNII